MWKSSKKDEEFPATSSVPSNPAPNAAFQNPPLQTRSPEVPQKMADIAHIGKSVIIRGELSGSEDLFLDGEVEGSIDLKGHSLTIGPNGKIRANVHAQEVVIHGRVDGNIRANDRVELKKSAVLAGDIVTQRIMIEDGAYFKGAIDIQKAEAKPEPKKEAVAAAAPAPSAPAPTFTPAAQPPLVETK